MLARALEVVFPPRCAGCADGAWPFCPACRRSLEAMVPPWCRRCGAPGADTDACPACPPASIDLARAPFRYVGPAKAAVHRLKFAGWRSVAAALADGIVALELPPVDAVTWVPLARRRLGERGFDQARALAQAAGRRLDRPVVRLTRRVTAGGPQARRGAAERRVAMRGAFTSTGRAAPARVLLVDDVLTTGATAADCARALREAGARTVVLATAARSLSRRPMARPSGRARGTSGAYTRAGSRPGLWLPGDPPR
jgi:ComF family protein